METVSFWTHKKPSHWQQHKPAELLSRLRASQRIHRLHFRPSQSRWLLCRPRGGLNDSLCQVHRCIIYAGMTHRNLVIDTTKAGFCDDFCNYFEPVKTFAWMHMQLDEALMSSLQSLPCRPSSLRNRLDSYELRYVPELVNYVESTSGQRPGIAWNDGDFPERLLVHDQCGGGDGCHALVYFKLSKNIRAEVSERLARLPSLYTSVIIRHSDVKLDYRSFLASVKHKLDNRHVLVSTDSYEALAYARSYLNESVVYDVADVPDVKGQTLLNTPGVTSRRIIIGCLSQLIALAKASEINIPSGTNVYPSGFVQLAMTLSGKDHIVRQLLG